jgi:hypothetical protein
MVTHLDLEGAGFSGTQNRQWVEAGWNANG